MMKNSYWVTQIETDIVNYDPMSIYLYNDTSHYQYFKFSMLMSMTTNYSTKVKYTMKPKPVNPAGRQPRFNPYEKPAAGKKNQVKPRKHNPNDGVIYVTIGR